MKNFLIAIIFIFAAFIIAPAQKVSKDEQAIRSLITKLSDAQRAYDAKTLDQIFTSDYIEISPVGEFDPREKVLGFYKPELKPPADKMTTTVDIDEHSIRTYDKFAVAIVRLTYKITADGKTLPPRQMRLTLALRKERSEWKIASAQYTGIRPTQPPKTN